MINKAIEKLTKEMMELNDPFVQAIEEHLTSLCTNETVAQKILQPNKTLQEACNKVRDKARSSVVGGVGAVSDQEAYRMVEEYFGINQKQPAHEKDKPINILDFI